VSTKGFRRLKVYREASALARELRMAIGSWTPLDVWTVGVQMVRAADSIGANLAEAYGRRTDADRLRLLWVARGSVCELQHWIGSARDRGLSVPDEWEQRADEVGGMVNGLARAWSHDLARTPSD
jgi:four helix bundle protein